MGASREDIISWGRSNGWEIPEDATRLPSGLRAAFDDASGTVTEPGPDDDAPVAERAPVIKREPVSERVRTFASKARTASGKKPVKARAKKPRVPVGKLVSKGWEVLAKAIEPIHYPVSRVLQIQAPVAGALLEDAIKDTIVDKALQPLARAGETGELAFALAGPPVLVAILSTPQGQRPEAQTVLVPLLKEALRSWIDVAGPKLKEMEAKDKAFQEEYGEQIDTMIASFFAPPEGVPFHPESE